MHFVIVGCGRVGALVASQLVEEGHSVAIVDREASAFRRLPDGFSGIKVEGVGFDRSVLRQAGIEEASALVAVTNGDNTNVVTARVGLEEFEVARAVARIYDPRRAVIYERLGVTTVASSMWTADRVLASILPARGEEEWSDPTGSVVLVSRELPEQIIGRRILDLESLAALRVVAVTRYGQAHLPDDSELGQQGDRLTLAVRREDLGALERVFGPISGGEAEVGR